MKCCVSLGLLPGDIFQIIAARGLEQSVRFPELMTQKQSREPLRMLQGAMVTLRCLARRAVPSQMGNAVILEKSSVSLSLLLFLSSASERSVFFPCSFQTVILREVTRGPNLQMLPAHTSRL